MVRGRHLRPERKERDDEAARDTTRGGHAGRAGYNRLIGSNQRDSISGGGGDDLIKGQRSIDSLNGGAGNNDIYAGPRDERARDTVVGGRGKDFVQFFNRPAAKDVVNCGEDRDRVVADSEDVLSDCERKRRPKGRDPSRTVVEQRPGDPRTPLSFPDSPSILRAASVR
jgi:hypothetical protein